MDIQYFHKYNRLVRRGLTKPLACPHCEHEYVLRATVNAEPVLYCAWCDSLVQPGINMYNNVRAVVKEFFA